MEAVEEAEMEAVEAKHQRRKDNGKDGVARTVGGTLGSGSHNREALRRCRSGWQTIRTQKRVQRTPSPTTGPEPPALALASDLRFTPEPSQRFPSA